MTRLVRRFSTWVWLAIVVACGGAPAPAVRDVAGADDDSLAAKAVAANAREQQARPANAREAPARAKARAEPSQGFGADVGFRSRQRLDEHFEKHGAEFGAIGKGEYLRQAQALRDAPVGGDILELRRGDGTVSRFDKSAGSFVAFDDDGTIRTFFKPNDGERYFRRQARRRPGGDK
ncbi:MAG: hypothetical protein IT359_01875 [Gemmatimonadaceae bacterium]|nr:hypothetical protein [Gemmatimonadaceae bacterium]